LISLPAISILTHYLEQREPPRYVTETLSPPATTIVVRKANRLTPEAYLDLYSRLGEPHFWADRLVMSTAELCAEIYSPAVEISVIYLAGVEVGFLELRTENSETEIVHFGIFSPFQGRGLGRYFLRWAVSRAWELEPKRVWLHTCVLDGKWAMQNYLSAGFCQYDQKWDTYPLPDTAKARLLLEHLPEGVKLA
jgi:GNAT superfamily N-acetyltransferase